MIINNTQFGCTCEEVVSELRQQLHANGIRLIEKDPKQSGDNIQIQCPYHKSGQERRLSAGIKKDTGVFHCFGCGETHTLPELISFCFGHTDDIMGSWGWQWLIKNFLAISLEERKDVKLDFNRWTSDSRLYNNRNLDKTYVAEEELEKYRYIHPYLAKRGIVDESIIDLFDIGFDSDTRSITFPVRDMAGHTLFIARRSVVDKFFNYPTGVEKPLYGLYELYRDALHTSSDVNSYQKLPDEIIVCESMIDCVLLWQAHRYAVALNGLGNELQFSQLRELPCRTLVLATDMDDAGMRARNIIKKKVTNKLIKEIFLPGGRKDIGECTKEEIENLKVVL